MQSLTHAEFLALWFALAVLGLGAVIAFARPNGPLTDALARRVRQSIAALQEGASTPSP
ncbi:hypothetical protein [Variovorax boronicumulans]|uniref:hypothetical protein n=1 Tax=Variovorax boronicumulans TaxID=436515 RepID=UPI001C58C10E